MIVFKGMLFPPMASLISAFPPLPFFLLPLSSSPLVLLHSYEIRAGRCRLPTSSINHLNIFQQRPNFFWARYEHLILVSESTNYSYKNWIVNTQPVLHRSVTANWLIFKKCPFTYMLNGCFKTEIYTRDRQYNYLSAIHWSKVWE